MKRVRQHKNKTSGYHSSSAKRFKDAKATESMDSSDNEKEERSKAYNLPVEHSLPLSYEEIYSGCVKTFWNQRWIKVGKYKVRKHCKTVYINIPAGCTAGTRFVFPGLGDQLNKEAPPGDLIYTIYEKSHPIFVRELNDLVFTTNITKCQLDRGTKIKVPTLSGDTMWVNVKKDPVKRIRGLGFPVPTALGSFGDLVIRLNIDPPKRVTRMATNCFQLNRF